MNKNLGRSKIAEVIFVVITVFLVFTFFSKKPLGDVIDISGAKGNVTISYQECVTDISREIAGPSDSVAIQAVVDLLAETEARRVKGYDSKLRYGVNLETVDVFFYTDNGWTEWFLSNEHSIIYITTQSKNETDIKHDEKAYNVPDDTIEKLKAVIMTYSENTIE